MLVIISDLHLGDGTCGKSISADAFDLFAERLKELAYRASWRSDGRYRPVESIDLLLLGDVLEVIHSTRWLEGPDGRPSPVRPWDDPETPAYAEVLAGITQAILENNPAAGRTFRGLSAGRRISLPPAGLGGRPARFSLVRRPVRVSIHYMVGNHDWYYHLPGPAFDRIRAGLIEAFGLSNTAGPFPHEARESEALQALLDGHRVHAQHGDLFDRLCYSPEKGRDAATLGDMLSVEILNRFPLEAGRRLGGELPAGIVESLHELVNVRPSLAAPLWISAQLRQNRIPAAAQKKLKALWDELGRQFLAQPYVKEMDRRFKFDLVNALQAVLKLSEHFSFQTIDELLVWVRKHFGSGETTFTPHALQEQAFLNRSAQFVVYGHSHRYEVVPLDSTATVPAPTNQMYLNSGTWHTFLDLAVHKPEELKFVPYQVQTYLAFYRGDERGGRRFEAWSGAFSSPAPAREAS